MIIFYFTIILNLLNFHFSAFLSPKISGGFSITRPSLPNSFQILNKALVASKVSILMAKSILNFSRMVISMLLFFSSNLFLDSLLTVSFSLNSFWNTSTRWVQCWTTFSTKNISLCITWLFVWVVMHLLTYWWWLPGSVSAALDKFWVAEVGTTYYYGNGLGRSCSALLYLRKLQSKTVEPKSVLKHLSKNR